MPITESGQIAVGEEISPVFPLSLGPWRFLITVSVHEKIRPRSATADPSRLQLPGSGAVGLMLPFPGFGAQGHSTANNRACVTGHRWYIGKHGLDVPEPGRGVTHCELAAELHQAERVCRRERPGPDHARLTRRARARGEGHDRHPWRGAPACLSGERPVGARP